MSQISLGGRKREENLKSEKPQSVSRDLCLWLLEVWNEIRKGSGMNQGTAELGDTGWGVRAARMKSSPRACSHGQHPRDGLRGGRDWLMSFQILIKTSGYNILLLHG